MFTGVDEDVDEGEGACTECSEREGENRIRLEDEGGEGAAAETLLKDRLVDDLSLGKDGLDDEGLEG